MSALRIALWVLAALALALWASGVATVYRIGPSYVLFLVAAILAATGALALSERPRRRHRRS